MANYSFGFIKPFGFTGSYGYAGSLGLAQIMYQTNLGDFIYTTNPDGTIVLDNYGSLGDTYDGLLYSGRGIELGATNDVDIPIHHTLGAELATSVNAPVFIDGTGSSTIITGGRNIIGNGDSTTDKKMYVPISCTATTIGDNHYLAFDYVVNSGTVTVVQTFGGVVNTENIVLSGSGTATFEVPTPTSRTLIYVYIDNTIAFNIDFTNPSFKQIINPNSYLTYYVFTDGLVTLGNSVDGGSSKELVINGTFDVDTSGWTPTDATLSVDSQKMKVLNSGNSVGRATQLVDTVIGRTYTAKCYLDAVSSDVRFYVGTVASVALYGSPLKSIGESGVVTVTFVATTTSTQLQVSTRTATIDLYALADDISLSEILPISTKYTINSKTVNNIITHTTPWSASDWTRINNNPNLIGKLALETTGATKTIPELDMVMDAGASADKWFMCAEPTLATLYNARSTDSVTIANYAETVRTNADLQQKGLQTTAFVTDGAGVPTAYSDNLLQFNGDGRYIDAGFIPPSDSPWEIDMVMFFSASGEYELSGIQTVATGNIVYLGKKNTNIPRAYIGGTALDGAAVTLEAYHYLTLTFDGAGNGKFIVDNTSEYPYVSSLYTALAGESFFVGSTSRGGSYIGNNHRNQIGIFSYVTRQRTSTERAAAYAKAKEIYPTLP